MQLKRRKNVYGCFTRGLGIQLITLVVKGNPLSSRRGKSVLWASSLAPYEMHRELGFSRETELITLINYRYWFMRLERPRNPIICHLQDTENQESHWCHSMHVWRPENQELQCPRLGEDGCLGSNRESEFALPRHFCSIQILISQRPPHWWEWMSLLRLWTQMLTSSRNSLMNTPRDDVLPV